MAPNFIIVHGLFGKPIRININMITSYDDYEAFIDLDEYRKCTRIHLTENHFYDLEETLDQIDTLLVECGSNIRFCDPEGEKD